MRLITLTGSNGLLGNAFKQAIPEPERVCLTRADLSLDALAATILRLVPAVVVNCAAATNLETAEQDPTEDTQVNAHLPALLADACKQAGALLVHFSSTGCYGNWKSAPYNETDELRPTTVHHRNKADGEAAIRRSGCRHLILRTGWLYGGTPAFAKNFVWKRLLEAHGKTDMTSDASQRGNPTYVGDLVRQTMTLLDTSQTGTFNVVAKGVASRFEYVKAIVDAARLPCKVSPGPAFARLAKVSPNEGAVNTRLQMLNLDVMPDWRASLSDYVHVLQQSPEWQALLRST